jgi:hypothetical protein
LAVAARTSNTYRFSQEQGLDVEDMRAQIVGRRRRVFVQVLLAALFVYHLDQTWPQQAVCWLRHLCGKRGLSADADGPYILLAGGSAVLLTLATILYAHHHPFPRARMVYRGLSQLPVHYRWPTRRRCAAIAHADDIAGVLTVCQERPDRVRSEHLVRILAQCDLWLELNQVNMTDTMVQTWSGGQD